MSRAARPANRAAALGGRNPAVRVLVFVILAAVAFAAVYPLFFMLATSLKTSTEYLVDPIALPENWFNLTNLLDMVRRFDVPRLFLNSVLYCAAALALTLVVSLPAAYAIARLDFLFRRGVFVFIIVTMAVPAIAYIVPLYVMFADLGMIDTPAAIILAWAAGATPGTIFLLSAFMRSMPRELTEAAEVDGAGWFRLMRSVVVRLSMPGLITVTVFNVTTWWNDLLTPLVFLQSDENATLTLGVASIVSRYSNNVPLFVTGLLLASIPPILTYILCQRYIRDGLVMGAVK